MTATAVETTAPVVKVGDFFYSSWGYDQTNVDFYKVVGMTPSGKSVRLQKWTCAADPEKSTHPSADYVVPGEGPATRFDHSAVTPEMDYWERQEVVKEVPVEVMTKRLSFMGGRAYVSLNSYSSASLWDGKPKYQTGYGYGH